MTLGDKIRKYRTLKGLDTGTTWLHGQIDRRPHTSI